MFFNPDARQAFDEKRKRDAAALLVALEKAIKLFPELRVGQIIDNATYRHCTGDIFMIENGSLLKALNEWIEEQLKLTPSRRSFLD